MKFAILPGSIRKESLNKKLAHNIETFLQDKKYETVFLDLKDFSIPLYDGDLEEESGIPQDIQNLNRSIKSCDALIVVTPEYNRSTPGVLKNVIDWISREKDFAFQKIPTLMMSASPGDYGGAFSINATRVSLERLGAFVYPEGFPLARADKAFNEKNVLVDAKTRERIQSLLEKFSKFAQGLEKK